MLHSEGRRSVFWWLGVVVVSLMAWWATESSAGCNAAFTMPTRIVAPQQRVSVLSQQVRVIGTTTTVHLHNNSRLFRDVSVRESGCSNNNSAVDEQVVVVVGDGDTSDGSTCLQAEDERLRPLLPPLDDVDEPTCIPPMTTTEVTAAAASAKVGWLERARQLYEFQQQHGHTLVPKRYKANPALGNWVNKQRQQYRNYLAGAKPCSLTDRRIDLLNRVNFCWDTTMTTPTTITTTRNEHVVSEKIEQWWSHLGEIRSYHLQDKDGIQSTSLVNLPRQTRLGAWLDRQRKAYLDGKCNPKAKSTTTSAAQQQQQDELSEEQISALSEIDPDWWMTRRQWQWELRFRELQDYAACHGGDCCVPISYSNKILANWVSNQRKQFNLRAAGKPSDLTEERFQRLEDIGFVWNRWEYEFDKKKVDWTS